MKAIARSFFSVLLSALVLAGSGGFTVGKMICIGDGHASYSLGRAKDCCEKNGTSDGALKPICCNLVNIAYSLNDFNPSNKINVSAAEFDFFHLPSAILPLPLTVFSFKNSYSGLPPPDIKDRLYSLRSLLL
jgi:hypothetical protein